MNFHRYNISDLRFGHKARVWLIPSTMSIMSQSDLSSSSTIEFIRSCSIMLELPSQTIGTALSYYHRYNDFMRKAADDAAQCFQLDEPLVATTCIHLACKCTEVPRKIRDVINVGHRYLHPTSETILGINDEYYSLRHSLITAELILLRVLGFDDLDVEVPYGHAMRILQGMGVRRMEDIIEPKQKGRAFGSTGAVPAMRIMEENAHPKLYELAQLVWTLVNDSLCDSQITLTYEARVVAMASVYLSMRIMEMDLPVDFGEWCQKWGPMDEPDTVKAAIQDLIEFLKSSRLSLQS